MREINANIIRWDPQEDKTYLNGSKISINNYQIHYKNELMSPGKAIVTWSSKQNYQADRRVPKLPALIPDRHYHLYLDATSVPEQTIYLKISFYSRFGELIKTTFIKEAHGEFTFPKAYEYQIELINAGVKELNFNALLLTKKDVKLEDGINYSESENLGKKINVVFSEPGVRAMFEPPTKSDMIAFNTYKDDAYLSPKVSELLAPLAKEKELCFIGEGELSNIFALYYGQKFGKKIRLTKDSLNKEKANELGLSSKALASIEKASVKDVEKIKPSDDFAGKLYENDLVF